MTEALPEGIVTRGGLLSLPPIKAPAVITPTFVRAAQAAEAAWAVMTLIAGTAEPLPPGARRCKFVPCSQAFIPYAENAEYHTSRCRKKAGRALAGGAGRQTCEVCDKRLDKTKLRADATVCGKVCRIAKKDKLRRERQLGRVAARRTVAPPAASVPTLAQAPRPASVLTEDRVAGKRVEDARALYKAGKIGLRGGARLLGVTAPTFAALLRRLGDDVRMAPRWQRDYPKALKELTPLGPSGLQKPVTSARTPGKPKQAAHKELPEPAPPRPARVPSVTMRAPKEDPEEVAARKALLGVLTGAAKIPGKMLDPLGSEQDQAEWDRCTSWRRMIIGLRWAKIDPVPMLKGFLAGVRERGVSFPLEDAERAMRSAVGSTESLYRVCSLAVEALKRTLPSRSSGEAEAALCAMFRVRHPAAPMEFSTVGH